MNVTGFNLDITNKCTLKCSGCARTRFIQQFPKHWTNTSLQLEQVAKFIDIDLNNLLVSFCGTYGDPIYHNDFLDFIQYFKDCGANISISTNGSYKSQAWWSSLNDLLDPTDIVIFGVDGTPENFTQYRENADWPSIKTAMQTLVTPHTIWQYIPFSYNINSIAQAEHLCTELGVKEFYLMPSSRYDEQTDWLKPEPVKFVDIKYQHGQTEVNAKCSDGKQHYISASGHYMPCCFIDDHRFYYKTHWGKNKKGYDIQTTTFSEILNQKTTVDFYNSLNQHSVCQFNCPRF